MSETVELGPIDFLVVEFPGNRMTGEGLPILVDLVDRGIIRVLDLVFVRKDTDGRVTEVMVSELDGDGQLAAFEGAASGLLASDDIREAAGALDPGTSAAILLYENRWAAPLAAALRRGNAQLVASGRIPYEAVVAAVHGG